jgi:hypothetical protein
VKAERIRAVKAVREERNKRAQGRRARLFCCHVAI